MRVVAILATYNEERFIAPCLTHLIAHGIDVYLIDNASTDRTIARAGPFLGRGLLEIEHFPRDGWYRWSRLLDRKAEVAATLDADWFLHVDADEIRLPPQRSGQRLADALSEVDRQGDNAVNFQEFAFVPTAEAPDHDHPEFQQTMRWYYPFTPGPLPHRLNAWKRQRAPVDLSSSGGHRVSFEGLRIHPVAFPMRHYLFLSVAHATRKYIERQYDADEVRAGWHRARVALRQEDITLVPAAWLRRYENDDLLDASEPRTRHYLFDNDRERPRS